MKNEDSSSLILLDIVRGYSIFNIGGETYYFKHFTVGEMLALDEFEKIEFAKAKKAGIQTEKQLIDSAIKMGVWSLEKEEKIKSLKWTINHSTKALAKMGDQTQRKIFSEGIERERKELEKCDLERRKISSYSAEFLADQKRFLKMARGSLFYDDKFKKPIKEKKVELVAAVVFSKFNELSDKNKLLKAVYTTYFFDVFICQSSNPLALFQTDFVNLTVFQKNILSFANALLNKMKNTRIPDEIYGDPIKMYDYEEPKDNEGTKVTHGVEDLREKMKSRGGELKPEDLLT
jgi:hypothetical protein